jgi:hypothetical protein
MLFDPPVTSTDDSKFGRRILTEGLRLEYLADPEFWLAIRLFAAFVLADKWLSKKVFGKSLTKAGNIGEELVVSGKDPPGIRES